MAMIKWTTVNGSKKQMETERDITKDESRQIAAGLDLDTTVYTYDIVPNRREKRAWTK